MPIDTTEFFCIFCGGNKDQCLRYLGKCGCPPFPDDSINDFREV